MKDKTITEMLREHQQDIAKLIDEFENDHSKIILLKKHMEMHHKMIDRLMQNLMLNVLMSEIQGYNAEPNIWREKLKVLREVVNHTMEEEKTGVFPEAEKQLANEKQKELGLQFAVFKSSDIRIKKTG